LASPLPSIVRTQVLSQATSHAAAPIAYETSAEQDPSDNPGWIAREPPGRAASDDKDSAPTANAHEPHRVPISVTADAE